MTTGQRAPESRLGALVLLVIVGACSADEQPLEGSAAPLERERTVMGLTRSVADFALSTSLSDVPAEVIHRSKEMMLNATGVGLAGSTEDTARIVVEYVERSGGEPACTILGASVRSSPSQAALANGTTIHVLDFDENIQRRGNHPSNTMVPVVMALGEHLSLSGRSVLEAFIVGCEVATKVGAAGDFELLKPTIWQHGWHLEGVACTIGAAVSAGKMLGLDLEKLENAIGIAVSQASGVQANYGTSTKSLHAGMAAMHGVIAGSLALHGFTGSRVGLEAANGFYDCFRRDRDIDEVAFSMRLGNPYDVIDPGVGLKLYPCASATNTSIDALLHIVGEHGLAAEQVEKIHVSVPRTGSRRESITHPRTGLEGKFSMPYCLAVALVHGTPRMHHFTDEAVRDPRLTPLLDRMTTSDDEEASIAISRPSTVTVTLTDGRDLTRRQLYPRGHPANPLTAQQLDDKFTSCAEGVRPQGSVNRTISQFRQLETLDNVGHFFSTLGKA